MLGIFFGNVSEMLSMSKRTFMLDFDYTIDFAVGFDPLVLEEHY